MEPAAVIHVEALRDPPQLVDGVLVEQVHHHVAVDGEALVDGSSSVGNRPSCDARPLGPVIVSVASTCGVGTRGASSSGSGPAPAGPQQLVPGPGGAVEVLPPGDLVAGALTDDVVGEEGRVDLVAVGHPAPGHPAGSSPQDTAPPRLHRHDDGNTGAVGEVGRRAVQQPVVEVRHLTPAGAPCPLAVADLVDLAGEPGGVHRAAPEVVERQMAAPAGPPRHRSPRRRPPAGSTRSRCGSAARRPSSSPGGCRTRCRPRAT